MRSLKGARRHGTAAHRHARWLRSGARAACESAANHSSTEMPMRPVQCLSTLTLCLALLACGRQPDASPATAPVERQEQAPAQSGVKTLTDAEVAEQLKPASERGPWANMTPAERERFERSMLEQAAKFAGKGPPPAKSESGADTTHEKPRR
jgi:hypothetical protein